MLQNYFLLFLILTSRKILTQKLITQQSNLMDLLLLGWHHLHDSFAYFLHDHATFCRLAYKNALVCGFLPWKPISSWIIIILFISFIPERSLIFIKLSKYNFPPDLIDILGMIMKMKSWFDMIMIVIMIFQFH